jgi:hypothetical protein
MILRRKNSLGALQTGLVAIKQLLQEQNRSSIDSENKAGGEKTSQGKEAMRPMHDMHIEDIML